MRLHAFLLDNEVVKVAEIEEGYYSSESEGYHLVIDVQDTLVPPVAGWVLDGNRLVPGPGQSVSLHAMIMARIAHYQSQAPALLRDLYATNTLMGITAAQSDAMFDEYSDVILRLQQGALPSAIYRLEQKEPSGFVTQEVIDSWIAKVQAIMI